jgi:hypothetical protein
MKNANVFVDVDLTLVDADKRLLPGAREGLQRLKGEGCRLFLWSTGGAEYCQKIAHLHRLTDLFDAFVAKPDILIDDMPGTCVTPYAYNVQEAGSWPAVAEKIVEERLTEQRCW